jgi:hypothetical protein
VRYAVALLVIPLTGIGFATRSGNHSAQYVVTVYLLLAGMFVLTLGVAYADHSVTEWLSSR